MDILYDFGPDPANPTRRSVDQLERLLACFQKALGLFPVRQFAAGWGVVRVHSQPRQGTTFTVLVRTPRSGPRNSPFRRPKSGIQS